MVSGLDSGASGPGYVFVFSSIWVRLNNIHAFGHCVIFSGSNDTMPPPSPPPPHTHTPQRKFEGARAPIIT